MSQLVSPQTRTFLRERKLSLGVGLLVFVIMASSLANFFFGWYAGFGEVVGVSLPPGVSIVRQAFTDDGSTRRHWISFIASQADVQTILVQGNLFADQPTTLCTNAVCPLRTRRMRRSITIAALWSRPAAARSTRCTKCPIDKEAALW